MSQSADEPQAEDDAPTGWFNLVWGVDRSVRYHMRREAFFVRWHRLNLFVAMLSSSASVVALGYKISEEVPWIPLVGAAIAAIASSIDLLVGPLEQSKKHYELRQRFTRLSQQICRDDHADVHLLTERKCERLDIEREEPPIYRALDLLCHVELLKARGEAGAENVPWYKRYTAHFLRWEGI